MSTKLHVFEVHAPSAADPRPTPETVGGATLPETDDDAKRAAREHLEARGYTVRSVSWGPGVAEADVPDLFAYVSKKESRPNAP